MLQRVSYVSVILQVCFKHLSIRGSESGNVTLRVHVVPRCRSPK